MGVDGRLRFFDEHVRGEPKEIIFSVKAGQTGVGHLRELEAVVQREKAQIGVLILMNEPTRPMKKEAASAGFYDTQSWGKFPRIQILTVAELLEGEGRWNTPEHGVPTSPSRRLPRAARSRRTIRICPLKVIRALDL